MKDWGNNLFLQFKHGSILREANLIISIDFEQACNEVNVTLQNVANDVPVEAIFIHGIQVILMSQLLLIMSIHSKFSQAVKYVVLIVFELF